MPREAKEACLKPPIIAFALTVCCTVLNPRGKDIRCTEEVIKKSCAILLAQLNAKQIPSKNGIMDIQDDSRDESNVNDYDDNNSEVHSEDDIDEDARLF
ncbi:18457_t:CDS:2, partial [Dentiscutata erythropus]